jgi:FtsP/CotA-like multicopper oxidase with cupredoxin domain
MSERTPSGLTTGQPPRRATTGVLQVVDLAAAGHDWEIFTGMVVHGYAFNGQAPGPVIEARVGDTLLVRFHNLLPELATIRWHGLREPAAMVGGGLATDPVPPGGRLEYQLHLPDAGTFWYHSPVGTTQSDRGLCGVLVVRDPEEPTFDGERVLLFEDLELDWRGQPTAPDQLSGYERGPHGEVLLVNGVLEPEMQIATGQVERWRLVNTSSARHLRLSLGGHQFHHPIRTDIPAPHAVDEVLMNPGERFDLAVGPLPGGKTVVLEALSYDRASASLRTVRSRPCTSPRRIGPPKHLA